MPDWHKIVTGGLTGLPLEDREKNAVIAELATHLEEKYEALRQRGAPENEAICGALSEVDNWKKLQNEIYAARSRQDIMNARTARFWLPSIVTLGLSVITLIGFALIGLKPGPFGSRLPHHDIWWARLIGP